MTREIKVALSTGYWGAGPPAGVEEQLADAEALGFDSVWTAEAYGSDALTPLAWWGSKTTRIKLGTSICQMSARTPTALAMAAQTLDHLSGGRVIVGIGASGPQVVEGWYGQPFARPLERTREYVDIMRQVWRRESPVSYDGKQFQLPLHGGTGLGKSLKSTVHPLRPSIPVFMGAEGPKNVALSAEIAEGWIPFFLSPKSDEFYRNALAEGFSKPGARTTADTFEIASPMTVIEHDDVDAAAAFIKPFVALYAGGMGAKDANFHNDVFVRTGWGDVVAEVQQLYLAGDKKAAAEAIPTAMIEDFALIGPVDKIVEEIKQRWLPTCITTYMLSGMPQPSSRERIVEAFRS